MPTYTTPCVLPTGYTFNVKDGNDIPVLTNSSGWVEHVGNQSTATYETKPRYAHASLTGWVSDKPVAMYNFENAVLGWHYTTADRLLQRTNPIRHPRKQNLFAIGISDQSGRVLGKTIVDNTNRLENAATAFYESTDFGSILINGQSDFTKWARYGKQLVTIEFAPPKYAMLSDAQVASGGGQLEYKRYIDFDVTPNFYNVTIQTGNFKYAEGPNVGKPSGIGEINYLEVKTTFSLRWRMVPEDFIGDTINYDLPYFTKIIRSAGRVNDAAFMGYPAGTLLMLEPSIERYVCGTLIHNDLSAHKPIYYCDVTLPIVHFDPPNTSGDPPSAGNRGHNLKPWWANGSSVVKYYLVTNNGDPTTGLPIYGSFSYPSIFTHWSL